MRWTALFIFAYVTIGLQLGVGAFARVMGVGPNLVLLLVVFVSLNAPPRQGVWAAFVLGFLQDLTTLQPLGLFAFSYGLVAVVIGRMTQLMRRGHLLTHLSMAVVAAGLTGVVLMVHDWVRSGDGVHVGPRVVVVSTAYAAVLAGPVLTLLHWFRKIWSFDLDRRRGRV